MTDTTDTYVPDEVLYTKTEDEPRAKPDISRYAPAIVNGEWMVPPGNYVIIEHPAVCLQGQWLDTRVYIVQSIDAVTGNVRLNDPNRQQQAMSNYKTGPELGLDFRIPPKGRNPETLFIGKRRRGRKKKVVDVSSSEPGDAGKKKKKSRGRPKGSKNRSKDVIMEEKKAKVARAGRRRKKANK